MIRNTMLGLSLFALLSGSALAATPAQKHVSKPRTVAAAPAAGDAAKEPAKADAPKADAPKTKGKTKKDKAPKGDKGGEKTEMKSAPAPETK
jgi:hypothetical protein